MNSIEHVLFLTTALLAIGTAEAAEPLVTLKDTFKDQFLVGAAVNRSMVAGGTGFRRSAEATVKDIALLKEQFNQIKAENDMKRALIHPREGPNGYDFGPADAFVNFGADIGNNAGSTEGGLVSDADKKLADAYAGIFRAFLIHRDSVKMVTFWGVNDAVSWRRQGWPLLFDGDNNPKPAFKALIGTSAEFRSESP